MKQRLFVRSSKTPVRYRERAPLEVVSGPREGQEETRARLQQAALDVSKVAEIVVDPAGLVALVNAKAAQLFSLSPNVVGQPFRDLDVSYRPVELRSCIESVRLERRRIEMKGVERIAITGEKTFFDVDVTGLYSPSGILIGTHIGFTDATHTHQLQTDLKRSNQELESAHQELQATSEELETTNEELQSTVEELETTNEELQSTNEELETMNEELQSTNEELQTINEELRQRGRELNDLNAFHSSVLASLRFGIVVLDVELSIRTWNTKMEDLWGMRASEVEGRRLTELDIGLPFDELRTPLRLCVGDGIPHEVLLSCTDRRGKKMHCGVSLVPLSQTELRGDPRGGVVVVVASETKDDGIPAS